MAKVTMQDIAKKLGVSKVTVSKALNDKEGVSESLKQNIKELAKEMGYRFNASAQAIKSGFSKNIGVIVAERFTGDYRSFYLVFYQHIVKVLDQYQYSAIFHILTDENEQNLEMPRSYQDCKIDGIIVLGQLSKNYIDTLYKSDVPVVFLDFYDEHNNIDSVISDNFYGAYEITNHLVKQNHKEIAFVGSIHATSSIQDRYLGYLKSMLEHNIEVPKTYIIEDRDKKGKFIDIILPENLPTAFVCNCDRVAYYLIQKLKKKGIKVPDDISVVGFDNDIFSTLSEPSITTVDVNMQEMASTAVSILIDKIEHGNKVYGRIQVKGSIVFRNSVKKI